MNNSEKFDIQENENCPICGGTGPCGDEKCIHGQMYEAEQLKKMQEAYEQNLPEEAPVENITETPSVVEADDDYDARGDLGYPPSASLRKNRGK